MCVTTKAVLLYLTMCLVTFMLFRNACNDGECEEDDGSGSSDYCHYLS